MALWLKNKKNNKKQTIWTTKAQNVRRMPHRKKLHFGFEGRMKRKWLYKASFLKFRASKIWNPPGYPWLLLSRKRDNKGILKPAETKSGGIQAQGNDWKLLLWIKNGTPHQIQTMDTFIIIPVWLQINLDTHARARTCCCCCQAVTSVLSTCCYWRQWSVT